MAAFDTNRSVTFSSTGRVTRLFSDAFAYLIALKDARATRKALYKLTARELEDIGLCYGDIKDITKV